MLKEVAERRRQEFEAAATATTRKREADEEQENSRKKTAKVVSEEFIKSPPWKAMLEPINQLLAATPKRKPGEPTTTTHHSLIDENQILLSSGTVASRSLKSGESLPDTLQRVTPYLPAYYYNSQPSSRSILSRRQSFSSSSRGESPSHSNVAFASPETDGLLGLGHSVSRTEQRIRSTGGRGLAYKEVDLKRGENKRY